MKRYYTVKYDHNGIPVSDQFTNTIPISVNDLLKKEGMLQAGD